MDEIRRKNKEKSGLESGGAGVEGGVQGTSARNLKALRCEYSDDVTAR